MSPGATGAALVAALAASTAMALAWRAGSWGSQRHRVRLERLSRVELTELFVFIDPQRFLRWNAAAMLAVPALLWLLTGASSLALLGCALLLVLPTLVHRRLRRRRLAALQRQLPDAISAVVAGLRGGLALWQALELVPRHQPRPVSQEFALVLRQHRMGVPLDEAMEGFAQRTGLHDVRMLVGTLAVARELGGGLAEALERLAGAVRRRVAMEERIRALTAQGRLQGWIVGVLPFGVAAALFALEPGPMSRLFATPIGWLVVALVLLLQVTGGLLIKKIVAIEV